MKKLLPGLFACTIFSCAPIKLTKEELAFNPYRKGDILVYKDSNNTFDTIVVTSIKKGSAKENALDILPKYHVLNADGVVTSKKHSLNNRYMGKYEVSILSLISDTTGTYLVAKLNIKDDVINPTSVYYKLMNLGATSFVIEPEADNYKILKEIHYHKLYGFTRYNYADGTITELVAFIRDNSNIYNTTVSE